MSDTESSTAGSEDTSDGSSKPEHDTTFETNTKGRSEDQTNREGTKQNFDIERIFDSPRQELRVCQDPGQGLRNGVIDSKTVECRLYDKEMSAVIEIENFADSVAKATIYVGAVLKAAAPGVPGPAKAVVGLLATGLLTFGAGEEIVASRANKSQNQLERSATGLRCRVEQTK